MHRTATVFVGLAGLLISSGALAAPYNESTNGDLSNNHLAPTVINLDPGPNQISGTMGTQGGLDRDFFRIAVPPGFRLSAVRLVAYNNPSPTSPSFIGVQAGQTFTDPLPTTPGPMLGYHHFMTPSVGTDILDDIGLGAGAMGFTPPLTSNYYTFWVQETGNPVLNYTFSFELTSVGPAPVPVLPAAFGLVLAAGLVVVGARQRSRWLARRHQQAS
jgi:hypothetical protein